MTEVTIFIVVGGTLLVALGGLASYMADRQRKKTRKCAPVSTTSVAD